MYDKLSREELKIIRETAEQGASQPPRKGAALRSALWLTGGLCIMVFLAWLLLWLTSRWTE